METPAQVEAVELTSIGYVFCGYSYAVGNSRYTSGQIGLDGVVYGPDYHKEMGERLQLAHARHQPITCFVNPDHPEEAVIDRQVDYSSLVTVAFGTGNAAALTMVSLLLHLQSRSRARREAMLPQRYPDQPWMWDEDWAQRTCRLPRQAALGWAFAIPYNVALVPAYLCLTRELVNQYYPGVAVVAMWGLGPTILTIHMTLRARKFGRSYLEIDTLPGTIGGSFKGTLVAVGSVSSIHQLKLTLRCNTRRRNGGSGYRPLWTTSQTIQPNPPVYGQDQLRIPFEFEIPGDCQPCDDSNHKAVVYWQLRAKAVAPGINLDATFRVPIFRKPEGLATTLLAEQAADSDSEETVSSEERRNHSQAMPE